MKSSVLSLIVLSVCCMLCVVTCQGDYGQVYCGRRLASALALLCEDTMETVLVKRSGVHAAQYEWPWLAPQRARSLARGKRQVVAECCDKPCTIDELLSYC